MKMYVRTWCLFLVSFYISVHAMDSESSSSSSSSSTEQSGSLPSLSQSFAPAAPFKAIPAYTPPSVSPGSMVMPPVVPRSTSTSRPAGSRTMDSESRSSSSSSSSSAAPFQAIHAYTPPSVAPGSMATPPVVPRSTSTSRHAGSHVMSSGSSSSSSSSSSSGATPAHTPPSVAPGSMATPPVPGSTIGLMPESTSSKFHKWFYEAMEFSFLLGRESMDPTASAELHIDYAHKMFALCSRQMLLLFEATLHQTHMDAMQRSSRVYKEGFQDGHGSGYQAGRTNGHSERAWFDYMRFNNACNPLRECMKELRQIQKSPDTSTRKQLFDALQKIETAFLAFDGQSNAPTIPYVNLRKRKRGEIDKSHAAQNGNPSSRSISETSSSSSSSTSSASSSSSATRASSLGEPFRSSPFQQFEGDLRTLASASLSALSEKTLAQPTSSARAEERRASLE